MAFQLVHYIIVCIIFYVESKKKKKSLYVYYASSEIMNVENRISLKDLFVCKKKKGKN